MKPSGWTADGPKINMGGTAKLLKYGKLASSTKSVQFNKCLDFNYRVCAFSPLVFYCNKLLVHI